MTPTDKKAPPPIEDHPVGLAHTYPDTPLFRQYLSLRRQAGNSILFFRLGDFFELFGDQAELASKLLGVTLTSRDRSRPDPLPMCGIPAKSLDLYLPKLIHAGFSVAIAEQTTSEPDDSGLFPREIVRTVTRFTLMDDPAREEGSPQNGIALLRRGSEWGAASLDLTSGRISVWSPSELSDLDALKDWLERKEAKELILECPEMQPLFQGIPSVIYDAPCDTDYSQWLPPFYKIPPLSPVSGEALSLLLGFISCYEKSVLGHLRGIELEGAFPTLQLDRWTIRHLDLLPREGQGGDHRKPTSLVSLLDRCRTPLGSRMLRQFILSPDHVLDRIEAKHRIIRGFTAHPRLSGRIDPLLRGIGDLERILARIGIGGRSAKDLPDFRRSFRNAMELVSVEDLLKLFDRNDPALSFREEGIFLLDLLNRAIVDEPAAVLGEGPIIRDAFDPTLAEFRKIESDGDRYLTELEERERKKTGIETLRIRYNQVAGYYIEVSRVQAKQMPETYFRKQTLTNTERFTLSELIEFEGGLREARSRVLSRESEILESLRQEVLAQRVLIHRLSDFVGRVDATLSFFETAKQRQYVLPEFTAQNEPLVLKNARHPVLEARMEPGKFMPNDTDLSEGEFIILTGPNMAGKSTYMRQVALIVIMAHAGAPVPADFARIPLVDRVIARVGASDNILEGASTFMVEMTEVSRILSSATSSTLVLLDEVGRGTATYDGMAIAWAVSEFLHDRIRCRTLFATHYHELSDLAQSRDRVRNQTVRVSIKNGELIFEHRIYDGRAEQSYGIDVARLAGVPAEIVERATEVLSFWEGSQRIKKSQKGRMLPPDRDFSMPLFSWKKRHASDSPESIENNQRSNDSKRG